MKVLFTVFSASGNTARVCRLFSERLKERGAECETVRIREDMKTPDYAAAGVLVIGYPVHGFNAPQNVVDFAKGLPECENKVYYIIKTSGEPLHVNDASSRILDRALKKKGYVKKGEFHYVMPYNMIFRHSDDMAALMWQAAGNTAPSDADIIFEGREHPLKPNAFACLTRFVVAVEHAAMPYLGRLFKVKKDKCVSCGRCEKLCPMGNIEMKDGLPVFGKNCIGCTACSFNCPEDAISIGVLNAWRVNGAYKFAPPREGLTKKDVCAYWRGSYVRYFREHGIDLK